MQTQIPVLSLIIFGPLIGVLFISFLNEKRHSSWIKWISLGFSFLSLVIGVIFTLIPKLSLFDPTYYDFQLLEKYEWLPSLNINYYLGVDGISLWLFLLTAFITPLAILFSFESIKTRIKQYYILLLILQSAMLGAFCALDLIMFYIFFEAILIPMYMIIGIWGGDKKYYAMWKFFFFTMVGSVLMLVAIIYLGITEKTFSVDGLLNEMYMISLPIQTQIILFWAFIIAFAIKIPLFPLHTWLSDAHTEAPTAGSVILAGVLLKLGSYGFIRFCLPMFPEPSLTFGPIIATFAVIGIIYGSLVAAVQKDVKRLVAYSSVAHMGFVTLGIFSFTVEGLTGSVLQQINHGLSTGGLFLLVGMIYDRRHTRMIDQFGGIAKVMPLYYVLFVFIMLASVGLPGLNGFVGEFMILVGSYKLLPIHTAFATVGVVLAAVYLLWLVRKIFYGPITKAENEKLKDLRPVEVFILLPIIAMCLLIGLYSKPFTSVIQPAVTNIITIIDRAKNTQRSSISENDLSSENLQENQVNSNE